VLSSSWSRCCQACPSAAAVLQVLLLGEKRNAAVQALGRAAVQVFGKSCCAGFCAWRKVFAECVLRQQHVS
jgi:hypothetical protein